MELPHPPSSEGGSDSSSSGVPPDARRRNARWLELAADDGVRRALETVYAGVAEAIRSRAPVCWASGRCCNFEGAGHLLYVTGLEAAFTLVSLRRAPPEHARFAPSLRVLQQTQRPRDVPGCPFQERNLCGVHLIKPLACRVYFCDRTAADWQHELAEEFHARIRVLHADFGIEYHYGEWRETLAALLDTWALGTE